MTSQGLSGDLEALPLLDTLNALSRHRKSGPLTLKTESDEITIRFDHGHIQSVTTSDQSLRIGRILVDHGFVTEEQIEQALALQSATQQPDRLGDVLVDVGYVTPAQITRAVAAQLEASMIRVLTQTGGTFRYVSEPPSSDEPVTGPLDFEPLVMNATYLADRWMAKSAPEDVETLPEHLIDPEVLDRLSPDERETLQELLDVYAELHRLAWRVGLSARFFKQAVLRLLEQAMIRIAMESHEDQQVTRRPNARYEQARLVDEFIDPWILDDMPEAASDVVLRLLNGVTSIYQLALESPYGSDAFDHAVLYVLDEQLIRVELPQHEAEPEPVEDCETEDETYVLRDIDVPRAELFELSQAGHRTLIAMLNGIRSLRRMSEACGLPVWMFQEGADELIERGFIARVDENAAAEHPWDHWTEDD